MLRQSSPPIPAAWLGDHAIVHDGRPAISPDGLVLRLLVVDPELGADLAGADLALARERAVLPAVALEPGPFSPAHLAAHGTVRGPLHGFLIVDGAAMAGLSIAGRHCQRLLFPGDLMLVGDLATPSLPLSADWSALAPTRLLLFDDRLLMLGVRWPRLMGAILRRAACQPHHAMLHQAMCQLPRVEDRLLALLWSIADRTGVVRADGVHVRLPLTHQMLADMIGARRPTVTLGLAALAQRGWVSPLSGGWLIDRASVDHFRALAL